MNDHRRSKAERRDKRRAFAWALLTHIVLLIILVFSVTNRSQPTNMMFAEKVDVVKATVKTEDDLKKDREAKKKLEDQLKLEEKRKKEQKKKEQQEKKKLQEKKKAEEKKKREAEKERKRIELKKKQEEQRKKDELQKKEEQKKKEEQRKKALAQQSAAEKERQRIEQERKDAFAKQLAAEDARIAEERKITLTQKYSVLIQRAIRYYWQYPPDLPQNLVAQVKVRVSFKGEVLDIAFTKRSGSGVFDRQVETTIYKASPLPIPSIEEDRDLNKDFQNIPLKFDINL